MYKSAQKANVLALRAVSGEAGDQVLLGVQDGVPQPRAPREDQRAGVAGQEVLGLWLAEAAGRARR